MTALVGVTLATCLAAGEPAVPSEELAGLALSSAKVPSGGLCLYLAPSDAAGLAKLAAGCRLQVQGVVADRERAERLRAKLPTDETGDRLSVVWRRTAHLPYLDNLADLIVAEGWGSGDLQGMALAEVVRALCPGGTAVVGSDAGLEAPTLLAEAGKVKLVKAEALPRKGAWIKIVKQFDPAFGRLAGGDTLGLDQTVAPSKEVRWVNTPLWGGSWSGYGGNSSGSYSGDTFGGGRSFHTEVDWIRPGLNRFTLVARNAFSGCVLWRENVPALSMVVAADETRVYVREGGLVARDAASGKVLKNYGPIAGRFTQQVRDRLIVSVYCSPGVIVVDKETGKTAWTRPYSYTDFPPAFKDGVVFVPGSTIEAVNLADGKTLWKAAPKELAGGKIRSFQCSADTLYVMAEGQLVAMDPGNGNVIWSDKRPWMNKLQVIPFSDQVGYAYEVESVDDKGKKASKPMLTLLDAKTGKEVKTGPGIGGGPCYGVRAADRYLIGARASFMDRKTFEVSDVFGVRGMCGIGSVPAYGLLNFGTHTCNCYNALRGIYALAGVSGIPKGEVTPQLIKGPGTAVAGAMAGPADWPLYRANPGRGNTSAAELPAELKPLWSVKLGGSSIPQATGAGGLVFVAAAEQHRIAALDAATGKEKWSFATEGRVSMAPTYHNGLCLVGDHAGWVYCLEAVGGRLVWQLQAAPEQKYMSAFDQFESAWPIKSGVLVFGDVAYFVAGRCGTMDGGIYLYGVDPASGAVLMKKNFLDNQKWERSPKTADLLLSDGQNLIGWGARLETAKPPAKPAGANGTALQPTLKFGGTWQGPNAILDMLATMNPAGTYMKSVPSDGRAGGETISFDKDRTITGWRELDGRKVKEEGFGRCRVTCTQGDKKGVVAWTNQDSKLQMRALLLAGGRVYCAGIPEFQNPEEKPALVVLSSTDGKELQRLPMESAPALDGLSAVGGRLVLTTVDGQVMCFGAK